MNIIKLFSQAFILILPASLLLAQYDRIEEGDLEPFVSEKLAFSAGWKFVEGVLDMSMYVHGEGPVLSGNFQHRRLGARYRYYPFHYNNPIFTYGMIAYDEYSKWNPQSGPARLMINEGAYLNVGIGYDLVRHIMKQEGVIEMFYGVIAPELDFSPKFLIQGGRLFNEIDYVLDDNNDVYSTRKTGTWQVAGEVGVMLLLGNRASVLKPHLSVSSSFEYGFQTHKKWENMIFVEAGVKMIVGRYWTKH